MKPVTYIAAALMLLSTATTATAQNLNNVQVFIRCYTQLTQTRPASNHPLVVAVRDAAKDPITACMEVFDKALFASTGTRVANPNDAEALAVLRTFHKLHVTWFDRQNTTPVSGLGAQGTRDILDTEAPALHFTRALFRAGVAFSEVLTGAVGLRAIRREANPALGASSGGAKSAHIFGVLTPHADKGDLLGVRVLADKELERSYNYTTNPPPEQTAQTFTGTADLGVHYGGGLLGEQMYLLENVEEANGFAANGAEEMPRKWGRSVFHDVLCRSLPVVRTEDAVPFVAPTSVVPFRVSSGCTRCHASMDRVSSVVRNFRYFLRGGANLTVAPRGFESLMPFSGTVLAAETGWPASRDANFFKRPPNGVLYFRNYRGELVDTPVSGLASLGAALSQQDDFYACAAKRYYQYFTGVDVEMVDVGDASAAIWLTDRDTYHRNKVIELGGELKTNQDARALIERILRLSNYRRQDFGAGYP